MHISLQLVLISLLFNLDIVSKGGEACRAFAEEASASVVKCVVECNF